MSSDKLDPGNSSPVLHFDHQAVFVASDVEHHPIVDTNTGVAVLQPKFIGPEDCVFCIQSA